MAACLCIVISAVIVIPYFDGGHGDPQQGEIVLSKKTTAKVTYGWESENVVSSKSEVLSLSEEEMFSRERMYVFRGRVSGLSNITIDFNGVKEVRCIATVQIEKVYQGDITAGKEIKMLIPCALGIGGIWIEDTDVITHLECGMEGIFMPWVYDEESYMEMNGATLMLCDIASCGLADGMRWAFLATDNGLVFERDAYPGAKAAENLDDIEAYVTEMLK